MDERIERLKQVAQHGNIDAFYKLIQEDVKLLEAIDELPFADTPLHIAASVPLREAESVTLQVAESVILPVAESVPLPVAESVGIVPFAMEMMRLKPSLVSKLNPDGYSPLHLALENRQIEMVRQLLQVNGDLVRVKAREGITLLHFAAKKEDHLDLLVEFLSICPHSIEDVTIQNETALHIALKNKNVKAFKFLVGWLSMSKNSMFWERKVLNWKDGAGNTVLHVAVSNNQLQAVDHLLASGCDVDVNVKNLEGKTALDIFHEQTQVDTQILGWLRRAGAKKASSLPRDVTSSADYYLRRRVSLPEKLRIPLSREKWSMSDDKRNALLVVATLLIAVTYQGILSPPGGVRQDDPKSETNHESTDFYSNKAGSAVGFEKPPFWLFIVLNSATFTLSYTIIFLLIPSGFFYVMFQVALFFLYVCYFASWTVIGVSYWPAFWLVFVPCFIISWYVWIFLLGEKDGIRLVNKRLQGSMLRGFPIRSWKKKSNSRGYLNIGMEELS